MKIRFKVQPYQTSAVEAVVDCFAGQPRVDERLPGFELGRGTRSPAFDEIVANADFAIDEARLLANVQAVARRQNPPSTRVGQSPAAASEHADDTRNTMSAGRCAATSAASTATTSSSAFDTATRCAVDTLGWATRK